MEQDTNESECMFKDILSQCKNRVCTVEILSEERSKVRDSSITRLDNNHEKVDSNVTLFYRPNCYLLYISTDHINRHLRIK